MMILGAVLGTRISRRLHRKRPRPEEEAEREIIQEHHDRLVERYSLAVESLAAALVGDLADQGYRTWERDLRVTRVDTWKLTCLTNKGPVVICGDMCRGRIISSLTDPRLLDAHQAVTETLMEWEAKNVRDLSGHPAQIGGTTITGVWA